MELVSNVEPSVLPRLDALEISVVRSVVPIDDVLAVLAPLVTSATVDICSVIAMFVVDTMDTVDPTLVTDEALVALVLSAVDEACCVVPVVEATLLADGSPAVPLVEPILVMEGDVAMLVATVIPCTVVILIVDDVLAVPVVEADGLLILVGIPPIDVSATVPEPVVDDVAFVTPMLVIDDEGVVVVADVAPAVLPVLVVVDEPVPTVNERADVSSVVPRRVVDPTLVTDGDVARSVLVEAAVDEADDTP